MVKRGRQAKHFSWNGELIAGLRRDPKSKRFFPVGKGSPSFGSDPSLAIHKFRKWKQEQGEPEPFDPFEADGHGGHIARTTTNWLRELILHDPKQAAIELDIPHLAFYPAEPAKPKATLKEMGQYYVDNKRNKRTGKPICLQEKRQSLKWWAEFRKIVKVKIARQITEQSIQDYQTWVMAQFDKGQSPTFVKHRFGKIKTILAFCGKKNIDRQECSRILIYCKSLETVATNDPNPNPISPEHFHKLLSVATDREKAILLTALNLCLHSSELTIRKTDLDFDKGTFVSNRTKTGVVRCAILWEQTMEAIKKVKPNQSDFLFVSRLGTPLAPKQIRRMFASLRKKTGLDSLANDAKGGKKRFDLEFNSIRDGSYTHATDGGISWDHARVLAGQRTGMADRYNKRNPQELTGDSCKAIQDFYGIG